MLKYGLRARAQPELARSTCRRARDPDFLRFVTGFTRHSTMTAWKKAMGALVPVNDLSLESFDLLKAGGVGAETYEAKSFLAAYRTEPRSARPCSRRSSTSTPPARTSSSTS